MNMIESKFIDVNRTKWQLAFGSITMAIEATLPDCKSLASAMPWRATLLLGGNHQKMTKLQSLNVAWTHLGLWLGEPSTL